MGRDKSSSDLLFSCFFCFSYWNDNPTILQSSTFCYSGIFSPNFCQKTQRAPLPPSQASASSAEKRFTNPGPVYCVKLPTPVGDCTEYGVPPVWLRLTSVWLPLRLDQGGQSAAALGAVALDDEPLATASEMDGLPVVTKAAIISARTGMLADIPHRESIVYSPRKACTKSGPWFGVGGPQYAVKSAPWAANGTEYW